ncbi:Cytosine/adenosine deaminase [Sinosporangium album]|uniref:Cytosine/adenosine deaminase n=1 Tax=Sinosporangium album TaxID=504805 RepID=A0A1G8KIL4_9ACTN|nr:amidohydrolase family protein [Sinosporangium album]SDI43273.1 Cytosine/adenosine deaminase [Sinosporangium album]
MSDRRILIKNGLVITLDSELGDLPRGDVLIQGGRIERVGSGIEDAEAEVFDAGGMIVMPGLIDTHLHMWQQPMRGLGADLWGMNDYISRVFPLRERFRAQDMFTSTYTCAIEALGNGTTTALDFNHNVLTEDHAEESLRAHRLTGQRVVFGYGMVGYADKIERERADRLKQVARMHAELGSDPTSLVRMGLAPGTLTFSTVKGMRVEVEYGRGLGLPMTIHQNDAGEIYKIHEAGLLASDIIPAHSNNASDYELGLLAQCGCSIAFTTEGEFSGGRCMSVVGRADRAGVLPTLGVDGPSFVAVDMLSQLRFTFRIMHAMEAQHERQEGRWPLAHSPGVPFVTPRRVLEYATVNAAKALGMQDHIGSLTPGKQADLLVLRVDPYGVAAGDPANHVVLHSGVGDIDSVMVGGVFRKRHGAMPDIDVERLSAMSGEVRARLVD